MFQARDSDLPRRNSSPVATICTSLSQVFYSLLSPHDSLGPKVFPTTIRSPVALPCYSKSVVSSYVARGVLV